MKTKRVVLFGGVLAVVMALFMLAGCGDGAGGGPEPGDPAHPVPRVYPAGTNISTGWAAINSAVLAEGKYVILDLSACTADDNEISGTLSPSGNDMNIIKDNPYIKGIILPDSLESIGDYAFSYCEYLTSVSIPETVTDIGIGAFRACTSLTSVNIPEGIDTIKEVTFSGCTSLANITIPSSVTTIKGEAFRGCGFTSIHLPAGVHTIHSRVFIYCKKLTAITVEAGNTSFSSQDGVLFNAAKTTLVAFPGGKSGDYELPASVTSISDFVDFNLCEGLTGITVEGGNSTYSAEGGVLFNAAKTELRAYPRGKSGNSYTVPESVSAIEYSAFANNTKLTSVSLPTNLLSIGSSAFSDCTGLGSISIPNTVTFIGNKAFYGCTGFSSVTIPASVTTISSHAFNGCTNLTTVTFAEGSAITAQNLGDNEDVFHPFPGNLRAVYLGEGGGAGTYTTSTPANNSSVWTK
jgi:hypothetical protein